MNFTVAKGVASGLGTRLRESNSNTISSHLSELYLHWLIRTPRIVVSTFYCALNGKYFASYKNGIVSLIQTFQFQHVWVSDFPLCFFLWLLDIRDVPSVLPALPGGALPERKPHRPLSLLPLPGARQPPKHVRAGVWL